VKLVVESENITANKFDIVVVDKLTAETIIIDIVVSHSY